MQQTLSITKSLADSTRIRVLAVLMEQEELCVCQITALLHLATATVSRHMSILHGAGLVQSRKEGQWVYYRLSDTFPPLLRAWLTESLSQSPQVAADRTEVLQVLSCTPGSPCRSQPEQRHGTVKPIDE
ncbi:MAG: metalloregulator ArsR/SmtB family transcription factor [Dehalococcoidia bacterium]|nr:metalloregulator ArsR/SmtB family transcription factor [Dehalococcoidia bacterium]